MRRKWAWPWDGPIHICIDRALKANCARCSCDCEDKLMRTSGRAPYPQGWAVPFEEEMLHFQARCRSLVFKWKHFCLQSINFSWISVHQFENKIEIFGWGALCFWLHMQIANEIVMRNLQHLDHFVRTNVMITWKMVFGFCTADRHTSPSPEGNSSPGRRHYPATELSSTIAQKTRHCFYRNRTHYRIALAWPFLFFFIVDVALGTTGFSWASPKQWNKSVEARAFAYIGAPNSRTLRSAPNRCGSWPRTGPKGVRSSQRLLLLQEGVGRWMNASGIFSQDVSKLFKKIRRWKLIEMSSSGERNIYKYVCMHT